MGRRALRLALRQGMRPDRLVVAAAILIASSLAGPARAADATAEDGPSKVYVWDDKVWLGVEMSVGDWYRGRGVPISRVVPDSPADHGGLKAGDVIVSVDGKRMDSAYALKRAVEGYPNDSRVSIEVLRGKKTTTLEATLETRPGYVMEDAAGRPSFSPDRPAPRGTEDDWRPDGRDFGPKDPWSERFPDLDLLFPPGWDRGLDPVTKRRLRALVDEMRRTIADPSVRHLMKEARRVLDEAGRWTREEMKDPFSRAPDASRPPLTEAEPLDPFDAGSAAPKRARPPVRKKKKVAAERRAHRMPDLVVPADDEPAPEESHRDRRMRDRR